MLFKMLFSKCISKCFFGMLFKQIKAILEALPWMTQKVVAEPSGALAFAAARSRPAARRGPAVALVTGGSVDEAKLLDWMAPPD